MGLYRVVSGNYSGDASEFSTTVRVRAARDVRVTVKPLHPKP